LARHQLIGWMAPGSELHLRLAAPLLVVCALAQPFFATCIILKTSMRGAGATHIVMRWSFRQHDLLPGAGALAMPHFMEPTLTAVWIVLGLDLLTQA
jgi:Na+-driven multidrug efflux pump